MNNNQTKQRIYSLFSHPSARFAKAVGDIADQRITIYHAENGNGYTEAEIIAMVQAAIAEQEHPIVPADAITYGGTIDSPDDTLLAAENVGKIFNIADSFTISPEDTSFVETFEYATTFPAGSNVIVVDATTDADADPVYKFDLLHGLVTNGSAAASLLRFETADGHIYTDDTSGFNLENTVAVLPYVKIRNGEEDVPEGFLPGLCKVEMDQNNATVTVVQELVQAMLGEGATGEITNAIFYVMP